MHQELISYKPRTEETSWSDSVDGQDWTEAPRPSKKRPLDVGAAEMALIEAQIADAFDILDIHEDEEDFVPYAKATLDRAVSFLRRLAIHAHSCGFSGIGIPDFGPGPRGSIDLHWRGGDRRLLVNFPADPLAMASFWGRKANGEFAARFDQDQSRPELVYWLTNF